MVWILYQVPTIPTGVDFAALQLNNVAECGTMDFTSVGKFPNSILCTKGDCVTAAGTACAHNTRVLYICKMESRNISMQVKSTLSEEIGT